MAIVFSPIKAKFNMRENYYNVKSRGTVIVDFIPMHESAYDTNRVIFIKKAMSIKDKKQFGLTFEHMHDLINFQTGKIKFSRKAESEDKYLTLEKRDDEYFFILEVFQPLQKNPVTKECRLRPFEFFYVKKLVDYSIPYVMGWYALGDVRLAEQNIAPEQEAKDPFDQV
jgi:hypothetical protein